MAKPAYSLIYAILITLGILALILFNRMIASDEAAPAAQASLQRNEVTAREAREAAQAGTEKTPQGEAREAAVVAGKSESPAATAAAPEVAATPVAKEEEERK